MKFYCPDNDISCPYFDQLGRCTCSDEPWEDCDTWTGIDFWCYGEWEAPVDDE